MQLFNQYSYVLGSLGMIAGAALILVWLRARRPLVVALPLALAALLAAGWLALRPGASDVNSAAEAEAVIGRGGPTLIEFFSNYCAGCIAARDEVTRLIAELDAAHGDAIEVLRVDIHTDYGRALRETYGFSYTPEFVLFDAAGEEIWRSHAPPTMAELEALAFTGAVGAAG